MPFPRLLWTAVLMVMLACSAGAGVLTQTAAYWYLDGNSELATVFDPDSTWLAQNAASLQTMVQLTVYDQATTVGLLTGNGDIPPVGGYLFAYSVSNLGVYGSLPTGLTAVVIDWGFEPLLVTTTQVQTADLWTPQYVTSVLGFSDVSGPAWFFDTTQSSSGVIPGATVGGLWAVAPTAELVETGGAGAAGDASVAGSWLISGLTKAPIPVPEPMTLIGLSAGLGALALRRKLTH